MDIFEQIQELVESRRVDVVIEPMDDGVILKSPTNINPPLKVTPNGDGSFWVRDTRDVDDGFVQQIYSNYALGSFENCDQSKVLDRVSHWLGGLR
jgi:hypothetical protein